MRQVEAQPPFANRKLVAAVVITTISTDAGADEVINRRTEDVGERVRTLMPPKDIAQAHGMVARGDVIGNVVLDIA